MSKKSLFVNALTFARVPLIFLWAAFAIWQELDAVCGGRHGPSVTLAVLASLGMLLSGLTDLWDGLLARRWNVVSTLGKMADPLMDKVYFIVAFPSLAWLAAMQGESPAHAVVLLVFTILWILRDQWVTFLRAVASLYHANVAAMWLGKVRTALSFPCAGVIYVYLAFHRFWSVSAAETGLRVCFVVEGFLILLNLYSFIVYTRSYFPYVRRAMGRG